MLVTSGTRGLPAHLHSSSGSLPSTGCAQGLHLTRCSPGGRGKASLQGCTHSHCQQVPATTSNQQHHLLDRSKGNIPEFLSSLLIRGCLTEKTFIIPALTTTVLSSLFFFPQKSSRQLQPSFSCTESSCSPAAQVIPVLLADLSASQAKTPAVHRSCSLPQHSFPTSSGVAVRCWTPLSPSCRQEHSPAHLTRPTTTPEGAFRPWTVPCAGR